MLLKKVVPTAALVSLILTSPLWSADEKPIPASASATAKVETVDIPALIKQLDSDRFSLRQLASQKLSDAGMAAIPALTKAAQSETRETSIRSFKILQKHFASSNENLKAAAKAALEQVAKGSNTSAARRANQSLVPPANPQPAQGGIVQGIPGRIRLQVLPGGRMQIRGQGQNGGGFQIPAGGFKRSITINNGVKEIRAEGNGKKIHIVDDPKNGIKIEITEKQNGNEVVKKYEANNADDLKKNHPDAYKTYKEETKGFGNIQMRFQGGLVPGAPGVPGAPQLPRGIGRQIRMQIERELKKNGHPMPADNLKRQLEKQLKQMDDQIEELKKQAEKDNNETIKQLELIRQHLQQLEGAKEEEK